MLSKVSALVMGIIEERPVNPYEINKFFEIIKLRDWFPVASSSVYATINALHRKGYITGEVVREGNMPEKTIYSITEEGKMALQQAIAKMLSSKELDSVEFNIGTVMMCHLEKRLVLQLLESRLKKLLEQQELLRSQYNHFTDIEKVPAYALISLKHNMYLYEAEYRITLELIEEIKKDQEWNHFLTKSNID